MAFLIEHKAQVLYIAASSIMENGEKRKIVIESRPEYAVISLQGQKEKYPISWEHLFGPRSGILSTTCASKPRQTKSTTPPGRDRPSSSGRPQFMVST